ncbi:hypothetical protein [Halomonas llamarensis]|uniref:ABC transmembrane type-1 domain-containing protein n=1 Tax=Halomonas llamarensis TaxID=2945104 RepID=A0ABT0SRG6_9GAMM|nr:hypothetical protein [Halomonas llamarensis]MCL7930356.1 hypothetical protein [Halomonas llamarensis]
MQHTNSGYKAMNTAHQSSGKGNGFRMLFRELIGVMLLHPWLLAITVLPNIVRPALEPLKAWITGDVIQELTTGSGTYAVEELLPYAPLAMGVFLGLGMLKMWEKLTNRMLDERLLIELQRTWFARRHVAHPGEQVTRAINDCENARKPLDLFQKELWLASVGLPAVLIWQISLGPELLPALLMAALPPFLVSLGFGRVIGLASYQTLIALASVGRAVGAGDDMKMRDHQESFYRHRVRFEWWKQSSEVMAEFAAWGGLAVVLVLSATGIWQLIPENVSAAQIGMFIVNLRLLIEPLKSITDVYVKMREGWPAVRRVLRPGYDEAQGDSHD